MPEVADAAPWPERFRHHAGAGFGIPLELADEVAESTSAQEVSDYLAGVKVAAMSWFGAQMDESLDVVPPMRANQERHPFYLEPPVWAEISDLDGLPAWQLLMRPAGMHIRRHVGEYDLLLGAVRSGAATPRA